VDLRGHTSNGREGRKDGKEEGEREFIRHKVIHRIQTEITLSDYSDRLRDRESHQQLEKAREGTYFEGEGKGGVLLPSAEGGWTPLACPLLSPPNPFPFHFPSPSAFLRLPLSPMCQEYG